MSDELKRLRKDAATFPARIEECQHQLDELPTGDVDKLEALLNKLTTQLTEIQDDTSAARQKFLTEQIRHLKRQREELLTRWRTTSTTCPTCGQSLPKSKVDATRNRIVAEGKRVTTELERLQNEPETVQSKANFRVERALKLKSLQTEIRELNGQLAALKQADKLRQRRAKLTADEKFLNARIVELEGQIATAQAQRHRQMTEKQCVMRNAQCVIEITVRTSLSITHFALRIEVNALQSKFQRQFPSSTTPPSRSTSPSTTCCF